MLNTAVAADTVVVAAAVVTHRWVEVATAAGLAEVTAAALLEAEVAVELPAAIAAADSAAADLAADMRPVLQVGAP